MSRRRASCWLRAAALTLALCLATTIALTGRAVAQDAEIIPNPGQPSGTIAVGNNTTTDAPIRDRIESILAGVPDFDHIQVTVSSGIVTLTGEVTDPASRERLSRLISRVDGVVAIENQVTMTTNIGIRLVSVRDRFLARVNQVVAALPFIGLGLAVGAVIVWLGGWLSRRRAFLRHIAPNPFISDFVGQFIRLTSWVVALVVALGLMEATALLGTLLGAAGILGLSLSFAMRDTIENFVASVLLSIRQPFRHNDLIEVQNQRGRVVRMTSRGTTLLTLDGNHIRIPNQIVYKAVVTNFTRNPERRFTVDLSIDPTADFHRARELALATVSGLDFVLKQPDPIAWFEAPSELCIDLKVAAWVSQDGTDFELARGEAFRVLRQTLDAAGFAVPEPIYRVAVEPPAKSAAPEPQPEISPEDIPVQTDLRPDQAFEEMVSRNNTGDRRDLLRRGPERPATEPAS